MRNKLLLFLLSGLIFTIPSNLFLKFAESSGYTNGLFIDYLLPKLYVSDVFALGILGLWLSHKTYQKYGTVLTFFKNNKALAAITALIILRQFFTSSPLASMWYVAKVFEITLLGIFLWNNQKTVKSKFAQSAIIVAILFQSVLAIFQYHTQQTLAGYWLLGEPQLSQPFGLAKQVVNGVEKVAPYGTTAHPNILAGVLAIYLLLLIKFSIDKNKPVQLIKLISIVVGIYALFLTGSVSAWLTFGIGVFVLFSKKNISIKKILVTSIIIFLLIPLLILLASNRISNSLSVTRRAHLQRQAVGIMMAHPLFGVGLNQFTSMTSVLKSNELVRFVQPVHHVGLLWLAETGMLGVLFLYSALKKVSVKKVAVPFLLLAPITALDHYLLSQQSGLLLSAITLIFFSKKHFGSSYS